MTRRAIRGFWNQRFLPFWKHWVVRITVQQVIVAAAMIVVGDTIYNHLEPRGISGIFDWTAHIGTSLLILNLLPARWRNPILPQALVFSVVIDADHIPQYLFHSYFLTEGTPRPYTHSFMTPAVALLIALLWPKRRVLFIGIAAGLLLHFFRDLAEEPGSGVSLLWPFSDHAFSYSHTLYLMIMTVVFVANLVKLAVSRPEPDSTVEQTVTV